MKIMNDMVFTILLARKIHMSDFIGFEVPNKNIKYNKY